MSNFNAEDHAHDNRSLGTATSGFSLIGTNCNTLFTWDFNRSYSTLRATVALDAANSGQSCLLVSHFGW
jgi:hypothetical protein